MIRDHRLLIDVGDITALELTCRRCYNSVRCMAANDQDIPSKCPHCDKRWDGGLVVEQELLSNLRTLRQREGKGTIDLEQSTTKPRVQFQVNDPAS